MRGKRRTYEEVWDKFLPLKMGMKVRYVRNLCKSSWAQEEWYQARDLAIGCTGTVLGFTVDPKEFYEFFKTTNQNFYQVVLDKMFMSFRNFTCVRGELEIVKD